ncbi:MAG: hypothetical protein ACJA2S_002874 [Cyclobacteriaceae bacterium]|jgi:hypothetical protein
MAFNLSKEVVTLLMLSKYGFLASKSPIFEKDGEVSRTSG